MLSTKHSAPFKKRLAKPRVGPDEAAKRRLLEFVRRLSKSIVTQWTSELTVAWVHAVRHRLDSKI